MSVPGPDPARAVYGALERLGIQYDVHEHPPVFTVEEALAHWAGIEATHCKNLFLRNKKGTRHYLVVAEHSKAVRLDALVAQLGEDRGYPEPGWTVNGLLRHLRQRFRILVSRSTLRRALPLAGFVWGRPKLILPERRDPDATAKVTHLNAILTDATASILAEDECEMMLLPILRATWHRRGEQPRVLTPGQNRKRPVFGTVNLRTGAWHYRLTDHKCSGEFRPR